MERLHAAGIAPAPLVRRMADSFGAERLVWGSDVGQSLRWPYADKAAMGRDSAGFLGASERALFLYGNAARIRMTSLRRRSTADVADGRQLKPIVYDIEIISSSDRATRPS